MQIQGEPAFRARQVIRREKGGQAGQVGGCVTGVPGKYLRVFLFSQKNGKNEDGGEAKETEGERKA